MLSLLPCVAHYDVEWQIQNGRSPVGSPEAQIHTAFELYMMMLEESEMPMAAVSKTALGGSSAYLRHVSSLV